MPLQHILKPAAAVAAFGAALWLVFTANHAASSEVAIQPAFGPTAAKVVETVDNSRQCDHAANVRERCVYF